MPGRENKRITAPHSLIRFLFVDSFPRESHPRFESDNQWPKLRRYPFYEPPRHPRFPGFMVVIPGEPQI